MACCDDRLVQQLDWLWTFRQDAINSPDRTIFQTSHRVGRK
jgi:hypothetical protein